MWFRRDLRLIDNPALLAAIEAGEEIVPVFILDPKLIERYPLSKFNNNSSSDINDSLE